MDAVLSRLATALMRLKHKKCTFSRISHHLSADGLRPTAEKVQAVVDAPPPKDYCVHSLGSSITLPSLWDNCSAHWPHFTSC